MNIFLMMSKSQLTTVGEVIDAFGGLKAMCAIFGGGPSKFCNHKAAGCFPPSMHMRVYVECVKRGLLIAPELVGMTEDAMSIAQGQYQRHLPLQAAE
jgi:hypothetical protein